MRKPHSTAAVVFDLDGTLVDSLPLVLRAISHAIEPFGPHRPTMDIFARLGGPPERFMPDLLDDPKNTRHALDRMARFHRENQHLIRPFEGVGVVLERLRTAGLEIAVWTGRDRHSTEQILREHALTDYFSAVVCGDDLPTHKPEPDGLREILRRLEVSAAEAVLVGDADVDVLGGAACAVDTVLIRHARQIEEAVRAKAWRIVTSPLEAYEIVLACAPVPEGHGI
jgi:HAD superfamily hydrolase (TIGR01549 family)